MDQIRVFRTCANFLSIFQLSFAVDLRVSLHEYVHSFLVMRLEQWIDKTLLRIQQIITGVIDSRQFQKDAALLLFFPGQNMH